VKRQAARHPIIGPWVAEKVVARKAAAPMARLGARVPKAAATARRDAATAAAIRDRRSTCGSRSSPRARTAEARMVDVHPVTVADVQPRASVATPRRAVTAADRRTAAVGTVEAATVDMGGKTTLEPFPA
jgi:hypothetical protein